MDRDYICLGGACAVGALPDRRPDCCERLGGASRGGQPAIERGQVWPGESPTVTATCSPNYLITTSTGTIEPGTQDIGNHCDDCNTTITLPFAYRFYGQMVTTANASSNGTLQFTSNAIEWENECLPSNLFLNNFIAGHWDDLRTDYYVENGIFTSVSGSEPNRISI